MSFVGFDCLLFPILYSFQQRELVLPCTARKVIVSLILTMPLKMGICIFSSLSLICLSYGVV